MEGLSLNLAQNVNKQSHLGNTTNIKTVYMGDKIHVRNVQLAHLKCNMQKGNHL